MTMSVALLVSIVLAAELSLFLPDDAERFGMNNLLRPVRFLFLFLFLAPESALALVLALALLAAFATLVAAESSPPPLPPPPVVAVFIHPARFTNLSLLLPPTPTIRSRPLLPLLLLLPC